MACLFTALRHRAVRERLLCRDQPTVGEHVAVCPLEFLGVHAHRLGLDRVEDVQAHFDERRLDLTGRAAGVERDLAPELMAEVDEPLDRWPEHPIEDRGAHREPLLGPQVLANPQDVDLSFPSGQRPARPLQEELHPTLNDGKPHLVLEGDVTQHLLHAPTASHAVDDVRLARMSRADAVALIGGDLRGNHAVVVVVSAGPVVGQHVVHGLQPRQRQVHRFQVLPARIVGDVGVAHSELVVVLHTGAGLGPP